MKSRYIDLAAVAIFGVVLLAGSLGAQSLQYGKEEELAGITKIFIDADGNLELRNNIVSEIMDDLPDPSPLEIVESLEDAELVIIVVSVTTPRGNPYTELKAAKIVNDGQALRLLWQWGDENTFRFGRRPSSRAADRFVELWKKHNQDLLPSTKK